MAGPTALQRPGHTPYPKRAIGEEYRGGDGGGSATCISRSSRPQIRGGRVSIGGARIIVRLSLLAVLDILSTYDYLDA